MEEKLVLWDREHLLLLLANGKYLGFGASWILKPTYIIWPLQLDRHILIARVVGANGFDNGNGCEVLDEYYGA